LVPLVSQDEALPCLSSVEMGQPITESTTLLNAEIGFLVSVASNKY
jgi:hypothetical protein